MAFQKKTWVNRIVQYPLRRLLTMVRPDDGSGTEIVDIQREDGEITQEGDAFSAENMNDLESRIETGIEERLEKVTTMPTASVDLLGVSVIYVGDTDSNYTEGNTYKCKLVNNNYKWVHIGAAEITVDSAMSTTSENPVQNKVVNSAISSVDTKATNAASTADTASSTANAALANQAKSIEPGTTATVAHSKGDYIVYGSNKKFAEVLSNISVGTALTTGTGGNIKNLTQGEVLTNLHNDLTWKDVTSEFTLTAGVSGKVLCNSQIRIIRFFLYRAAGTANATALLTIPSKYTPDQSKGLVLENTTLMCATLSARYTESPAANTVYAFSVACGVRLADNKVVGYFPVSQNAYRVWVSGEYIY